MFVEKLSPVRLHLWVPQKRQHCDFAGDNVSNIVISGFHMYTFCQHACVENLGKPLLITTSDKDR
jgi:hypothetical protein